MNRAGCLVVVLVLASAFLHVKISVKVVRVFLGNVTSFWSTFVLGGGGGNVTFHGIQFPREYFINRHLEMAPERDLITHDVRDFPGNPN